MAGWIEKIGSAITMAFDSLRPPIQKIPALLLACEIASRPGLSAITLTASVIRRLPEVGIPTGVNPDGSPNMVNGFVKVMCEEIVKELQNNARIDSVVNANDIVFRGTGANVGGPMEVFGSNIISTVVSGLIR